MKRVILSCIELLNSRDRTFGTRPFSPLLLFSSSLSCQLCLFRLIHFVVCREKSYDLSQIYVNQMCARGM